MEWVPFYTNLGHRLTRINTDKKEHLFRLRREKPIAKGTLVFQKSVPPPGGRNLSEITARMAGPVNTDYFNLLAVV